MDPLLLGAVAQKGQQIQNTQKGLLGMAYNEWNYGRQRKHNLEFWRMQNAYNAPTAQMQRLRDAGLNPNLVYGRGAGAVGEAAPPKTAETPKYDRPPPSQSPFFAGMDMKMKTAQTDNLNAQNTVLLEEAMLKNAQTASVVMDGKRKGFDLELDKELRDISAEYRRELLRGKSAEIDVMLSREQRDAAMHSPNMAIAMSKLLHSEGLRYNTHLNNQLKEIDLQLWRKYRIKPGDPYWMRILTELFEEIKENGVNIKLKMPWENAETAPNSSW